MSNVRSIADYRANQACKMLIDLIDAGVVPDIPQSRQELDLAKMMLKDNALMKESVEYIEFILQMADEGKVRLNEG